MDASQKNVSMYKAGFTNTNKLKDRVTHTPLKIVPGISDEQLSSLGLKRTSHPTPTNPGSDGRGK